MIKGQLGGYSFSVTDQQPMATATQDNIAFNLKGDLVVSFQCDGSIERGPRFKDGGPQFYEALKQCVLEIYGTVQARADSAEFATKTLTAMNEELRDRAEQAEAELARIKQRLN